MYNLTICQCLYLKKRIDAKIDGWNANKNHPNLGVPNWQPNSKPYLYVKWNTSNTKRTIPNRINKTLEFGDIRLFRHV